MPTLEKTITIVNKLGLHARAATKLAQLSQQFQAKVTLTLGNNSADAHSVMALLLLSGGQGKSVTIKAQGKEAAMALEKICQLIENKFDEVE
jgi:phosphotransferase system HPr (HPr) family protein